VDSDLIQALVAGVLGGGVTGAVIAGFISLRTQARSFEREDRYRFVDLKRERYAELLGGAEDYVGLVAHHRSVATAFVHAEAALEDIPSVGDTNTLNRLAAEVRLLAPEPVSDPATRMVDAVGSLIGFVYLSNHADVRAAVERKPQFDEATARYVAERDRFVRAAKSDLGTE
jgi:hypothetical protein